MLHSSNAAAKVMLFPETTKRNAGNLRKLFEREFCQFRFQLFCLAFADAKHDVAGVVIGLTDDARIHFLDNAHDVVHLRIGKRILDDFLYLARLVPRFTPP